MSPEIEQKLIATYPKLFAGVGQQGSCMNFGCEHGDGWAALVETACRLLDDRGSGAQFSQVKEKFGTLRIYVNGGDDYTDGVIDAVEALSASICEACGSPGSVREGGWIVTRCDKCLEGGK